MIIDNALWLNLSVALRIGLLIGAERERNKAADAIGQSLVCFAVVGRIAAPGFESPRPHTNTLPLIGYFIR